MNNYVAGVSIYLYTFGCVCVCVFGVVVHVLYLMIVQQEFCSGIGYLLGDVYTKIGSVER